jgi:Secretion system C-terminal sorting domain
MKNKLILILFLTIAILLPVFAAEKGKVYLVIGSDTAIWEGLSITKYDGRYFKSGLYTDPARWGYGVMDSTYRNSMVDSYGTPVKMTWWMMAGNVYHLSNNCNIPIRNNITMYLMKKYHLDALNGYDDQLTLHYHNYYWSDPNGDGDYNYNQGLDFRTNQADYEECLSKFLIEDDVFPISFRSGWHYMDNYWQAYQERFIPFDMSNAYPSHGGDYEEPTNNIIDWSQSPDAFVPYHPNADNYQIEGDLKQWRLRSLMYTSMSHQDHVETLFREAANGNDQMVCLWSHLPQDDFLPDLVTLNQKLHEWETEYGVEFMYCKDIEAMRIWIDPEDTIAPKLTVNEIPDGGNIRFEMVTDGPIFQVAEPFIAVKNIYEEYIRLDCSITGENRWETIDGIPLTELAKVSVAVCDTVGNQAKVHLDYLPDDIFIDDKSDKFIEKTGDWNDYLGDCELWDLSARVLSGKGVLKIVDDKIDILPNNSGRSFIPSRPAPIPCAIYFHGPGSTSDSIRVIAGDIIQQDTLVINKKLLGRDKWQFVGYYDDMFNILANDIIFENLDSNSNLGIDVIRITPLVADKNFMVDKEILTFGDVCVTDTATMTIELSNMGREDVTVTELSVLGSKLEIAVKAPFVLGPMEVKEVPISFYTDYFMEYNDILTIKTDDPRHSLLHIPVLVNSSNYFKIVDNDEGVGYYEDSGTWNFSSAGGYNGSSRYASIIRGRHADFSTEFSFSGSYDLQYYVPETVNAHNHADYIIIIDGVPQDTVVVDQNLNSGHFVSIGEFDLPKDVEVTLRIQDNGGNTQSNAVLRADAVKFILIEEKFVSSVNHAGIPEEFKLFQNYPNPFNPSTQIYFALPQAGEVSIDFFDLQGKKVDETITRNVEAGYHHITWSPVNLASGIYFYRVTTPVGMAINKCTFVK